MSPSDQSQPRAQPSSPDLDSASYIDQVAAFIRSSRYKDAKTLLAHALDAFPENAELHYQLGLADFRTGDIPGAQASFAKCVEIEPVHSYGQYGLGITYYQQGEFNAARRALEVALQVDPTLSQAQEKLAEISTRLSRPPPLQNTGSPTEPAPAPPTQEQPHADPAVSQTAEVAIKNVSLADILDSDIGPEPDEEIMAGDIVWEGRPSFRGIIGVAVGSALLVLLPVAVEGITTELSSGFFRSLMAALWRVSAAASLPVAIFLFVLFTARLITRRYVFREHRVELFSGLLKREHIAMWLHDLERPVVIKQSLLQLALGLATIELHSTILPASTGRRRADRPGRIVFAALQLATAEQQGSAIRAKALWQRRRMVKAFVSSR